MLGTLLNGAAIVVGGVIGLAARRQLSAAHQSMLKIGLAVLVIYAGLSTTWQALNGTFLQILGQLGIVIVSMMIGKALGQLLRIQKNLNRLGQFARKKFDHARPGEPGQVAEGFITCALLFCVGPMAILGAVQDGLTGNYRTLAVKALMDGLATMAFVTSFGWGVMLSAVPVVAYQGTVTLLARVIAPYLENQALIASVNATGGLLIFCIALIILELKRIELSDYLPSLAVAPLLTWLVR